jgi:membrane dipeptidase
LIVDGHLDIAWNALSYGRGFEGDPAPGHLVSRRSLESAGVGLVFATLFAAPASEPELAETGLTYRTAREARLQALAQLGYYAAVGLPLVRGAADLDRRGLQAVVLMEGADPIETPAQVGDWWERGVRIIGPAWGRTRYAGGTHAPGGLTAAGRRLLKAMAAAEMILDLSHLAQDAVDEALGLWKGPLIASHSNARALVPGDRQLADETAAEVGRRGGMLGVSFYRGHLRTDRERPSLEDVAAHLRHLAVAAGGPEHLGLGTDCDGGFAADAAPFDDYGRIRDLRPLLRRHFSVRQVEGIMGGNWLAFLRRSLPTG